MCNWGSEPGRRHERSSHNELLSLYSVQILMTMLFNSVHKFLQLPTYINNESSIKLGSIFVTLHYYNLRCLIILIVQVFDLWPAIS